MAGNNSTEGLGDDFFEQILAVPEAPVGYGNRGVVGSDVGMLQLGSTTAASALRPGIMPLGLNLEQSRFLRHQDSPNFLDTNIHHHHHHHHLTLHNNHTSSSSSPSSTAPITVCSFIIIFSPYLSCSLQILLINHYFFN